MLRIDCYTVTSGLMVVVTGVDTRMEAPTGRVKSSAGSQLVDSGRLEDFSLERCICTAVTDILEQHEELSELVFM